MKVRVFWEKYKAYAGIFLLLILPAIFVFFFVQEEEVSALNEPVDMVETEMETFFVDISGQVNNPGVYEVEGGMILIELVDKAGGLTNLADLVFIAKNLNLSQKLVPEYKLYIPQVGEMQLASQSPGSSEKVNLNTASVKELDSLPGIGEATVQKIIEARPFKNIEDLKSVSGIGDAKFNEIKDKVSV
ncbi:helix-hairpin-helix domain-containing protein [Candidatus Dojkabacteria bacterium]|nr:helix-hairpin-helix domain-containing protein [Candidatus Dojkabacteria bacterium]